MKSKNSRMAVKNGLSPILYENVLTLLNATSGGDDFYTTVNLDDNNWMKYTLSSHIKTTEYGDLDIEFEYFGIVFSEMKVSLRTETYLYRFQSSLFKKHIVIFLQKHIGYWNKRHAFFGLKEVIDFYNDILANGKLIEINKK